jgi:hypothetical protein
MPRIEGLDQDPARMVPPSGTTRRLGEQMVGSFSGAKVRESQMRVSGEHSHQSDPGEVVSLRQHLSPDHQIDVSSLEASEQNLVPPASGSVAIHSRHSQAGIGDSNGLLQLLGAGAASVKMRGTTPWAGRGKAPVEVAIVATQHPLREMMRQSDAASGTVQPVPAGAA